MRDLTRRAILDMRAQSVAHGQLRRLGPARRLACPLLSGPLTMFGLDLEGADHGTEAARA
jgi:hypothetical protein